MPWLAEGDNARRESEMLVKASERDPNRADLTVKHDELGSHLSTVPGTEVCDFCSGRPVVWTYHVLPLPMGLGRSSTGTQHVSNDDWAACEHCKVLIDGGQRAMLVSRSLMNYPGLGLGEVDGRRRQWALTGQEQELMEEVAKHVLTMHDDFFRVKDGPGEPHADS